MLFKAYSIRNSIVHGSDCAESAKEELFSNIAFQVENYLRDLIKHILNWMRKRGHCTKDNITRLRKLTSYMVFSR